METVLSFIATLWTWTMETLRSLNPRTRFPAALDEKFPLPSFEKGERPNPFLYRFTGRNIVYFTASRKIHNRKILDKWSIYLREILAARWNPSQDSIKICYLPHWLGDDAPKDERDIAMNALKEFLARNGEDALPPDYWVVDGQHRIRAFEELLNNYDSKKFVDCLVTVGVPPSTVLKCANIPRTVGSHADLTGAKEFKALAPIRNSAIGGKKQFNPVKLSPEHELEVLKQFPEAASSFASYAGTKMFSSGCNNNAASKSIGFLAMVQANSSWNALKNHGAVNGRLGQFLGRTPSPSCLTAEWERFIKATSAAYRADTVKGSKRRGHQQEADRRIGSNGGAAAQYATAIQDPMHYGFKSSTGGAGQQFNFRLSESLFAWWLMGKSAPAKVLNNLTDGDGYCSIIPLLSDVDEV